MEAAGPSEPGGDHGSEGARFNHRRYKSEQGCYHAKGDGGRGRRDEVRQHISRVRNIYRVRQAAAAAQRESRRRELIRV